MKTLVVLFVILFCMAIGNAKAQSVSTKTVGSGIVAYVQCDGTWDVLSGTITSHFLYHEGRNGWKVQKHAAELTSAATGEVFRMNGVDKMNDWGQPGGEWTVQVNLIGNEGTHLIGWVVMDVSEGKMNITELRVKCQ